MGDRSTAARCAAANLHRSRRIDDNHSARAEPFHAGHSIRMFGDSVGPAPLSGSDQYAETITDAEAIGSEFKYRDCSCRHADAEVDTSHRAEIDTDPSGKTTGDKTSG